MSSIKYRKDIDGLRAIAVSLVVLGHAQFEFFQGGFIGVDVFFVISGYLITSIIVSEIDKGIFSFKNFYSRRIRRILPALILMLLVVSVASLFILFPKKLMAYSEAQFASLTSWSNFFLWRFFGGYWRNYVQAFPLTHTWSLSVEEQFYFVWPSCLYLAYKFIPRKYHNYILALSFLSLLALSQFAIKWPEFAFYMIPARAFELLIGAWVAIIFRSPVSFVFNGRNCSNLVAFIGVLLILLPAIVYRERMPFPGVNALWPCLGTVLLILPRKEHSFIDSVLSTNFFVSIGKVSYSWYLWHWPPFAFLAYAGYSIPKYRFTVIVLSLIVSYLSYRFIEQPFRKSRRSFVFLLSSLMIVPSLLAFIFFQATNEFEGFPERFGVELSKQIVAVESSALERHPGAQFGKGSPVDSHIINDYTIWGHKNLPKINALLIGDSHATAIRPFVEDITKEFDIKGVQTSRDSTPFLLNVDFYDRDVQDELVLRTDKKQMIDYWTTLIDEKNIKYVFIAAFYYSRIFSTSKTPELMKHIDVPITDDIIKVNKRSFELGLHDSIKFIIDRGKIPILFKDVPYVVDFMSLNFVKNKFFGTNLISDAKAVDVYRRHAFEDTVIDSLKQKFPSLIVIDPKRVLCPEGPSGPSLTVLEDVPLYTDGNHLNYYGAKKFSEVWMRNFENPLNSLFTPK